MARLRYLGETQAAQLADITKALFPDSPAFVLRRPDGEALLSSALFVPRQPNYRTLPQKAAALQYHLTMNHPFLDGNKRFAVAAMEAFLALNQAMLAASDDQLLEISLAVASHEQEKPDLIRWVEQRTHRGNWNQEQTMRWLTVLPDSVLSDITTALEDEANWERSVSGRITGAIARLSASRADT